MPYAYIQAWKNKQKQEKEVVVVENVGPVKMDGLNCWASKLGK